MDMLQYNMSEVPKLMPMHFFSMITADEVVERIQCKVRFDQGACHEITLKRCFAQEPNSLNYETCMVNLIFESNAYLASKRRMLGESE